MFQAEHIMKRPVIYQLFVRHFSNPCKDGVEWGSKQQNGCGTFAAIDNAALQHIAALGVTHIWLTGVLQHATQTANELRAADPACIVKGLAGSPYAITDPFALDLDLALNPNNIEEEFRQLLQRIKALGMQVLLDLIPNHMSRGFDCKRYNPQEDTSVFYSPHNLFYYLDRYSAGTPPLVLPGGAYAPESDFARVSGNNIDSWQPGEHDWFETVKLNYGYDLRKAGQADEMPHYPVDDNNVACCWKLMDDIVRHWQGFGVDGFRCDMAHMVPKVFWRWLISRAKQRAGHTLFIAEGYNDHLKANRGDAHANLLQAGFDAVYNAEIYHLARAIYEEHKWANDLDALADNQAEIFNHSVRYAENHDEVRIASPQAWGGQGQHISAAISACIWYQGPGVILLYNGQEVAEQALGPQGYGGGNARSSIFDYTCLPRLQLLLESLSDPALQLPLPLRQINAAYQQLLAHAQHPALVRGQFYGLNWANRHNALYRDEQQQGSNGHYLYSFIRYDAQSGRALLCLVNLCPWSGRAAFSLQIPEHALSWAGREATQLEFAPLQAEQPALQIARQQLIDSGLQFELCNGSFSMYEF